VRFHHFGVATRRMDRTRSIYESLGYEAETSVIDDIGIGVSLQFLIAPGAPRIELVAPLVGERPSPVTPFVERGVHVYHHAFEVPDLDAAIDDQLVPGRMLAAEPQPAVAFDGRPVAFITLTASLLLELIQEPT
jgi:methylmalonyl-CoA/ethylmalonyl-CoA epimerase